MPDGVTGLDELLRRLDRLPLALSRDVARDALQAAGEVMRAAVESTAPVRRGELRESIGISVRVSSDFRSNSVRVGPSRGYGTPRTRKRGMYAGGADPTTVPAVYGRFVEKGHGPAGTALERRRVRRSGREIEFGGRDTPPRPFMGPAFRASQDEAIQALADTTAAALSDIERLVG